MVLDLRIWRPDPTRISKPSGMEISARVETNDEEEPLQEEQIMGISKQRRWTYLSSDTPSVQLDREIACSQ